ncbi:hypothetical protein CCP4SC76_800005 [Gammaproteobacteria bacterium]
MSDLTFTVISSVNPAVLTKRYWLDAEGRLNKQAVAQMVEGTAEIARVPSLAVFADLLDDLRPCNALTYGIAPGFPNARIVSRAKHTDGDGAITRTRAFFQFPPAPGIMMLDYDPAPGSEAMTAGELVEAMRRVCPPLFNAPILHRPSVSSGIRTFGGQPLTGVRGQRLYIAVADTSLIPKAGKALEDLLWATGHGYVVIGKAGQILSRTLIDGSVWQPERLDFAAPPLLAEGLTRDQPANWLCGNDAGDPLDLRKVIEMADGTVVTAAVRAKDTAKAGVQSEAQTVLGEWVEVQAEKLSKARKIPLDTARATVARAAVKRQLTGDFLLTTPDGAQVSVGEMLDHLDRWHGKRFADPLEPDYGNDSRIAWANLRSGGRPYVYSHAHGGRRFYLIRPSARIQLADGQRARVVDSLLDLMRTRRELYDMGGGSALARVTDDAKAIPANQDWLVDHFDRTVEFFSIKEAKEGPEEVPRNAPVWAARAILAKDGERRLSRLDAVVTAPTLRVDGSIISEPGYDPVSRLLFLVDTPDSIHVPLNPTLQMSSQLHLMQLMGTNFFV